MRALAAILRPRRGRKRAATAVLAVLVGLNLALSYLAWRQPKACGIGSSSAARASSS